MKHLKIYHAIRLIQREGSIRKAAEALAVSPSALNRSVQTFEESIGVDVFERIPAGVRLTAAGELLLDVVARHLIEFEELQRQFGNLRDGQTGKLRVGLGDDIAAGLPLLAIRDLEDDMPGVSADITSGDALHALRRREIDLAIVTNPETDRSVEVLASQEVRLAAFATPGWMGPEGHVGLWDLAQSRLVLPPEGTGSRTVISHAFRRHALDEGPATSVAAAHLPHAMATGARACIFPRTVFDGPTGSAGLNPLALEVGPVQISVLRLTGVPLSRPAQGLLRHMERRLNAFGRCA
jgi:DNA-binding transcriptional LysR family regulator